mgnify:CR=1 FL=1
MFTPITALAQSFFLLRRYPLEYIAAGSAVALAFVSSVVPFLSFVTQPFAIGAMFNLTVNARSNDIPTTDEFISGGKTRFMVLLKAIVIEAAVLLFVVGGTVVPGLVFFTQYSFEFTYVALGLLAAILISIQFFSIAIVRDNFNALESFKYSIMLVEENILPVLGYSVIRVFIPMVLFLFTLFVGGVALSYSEPLGAVTLAILLPATTVVSISSHYVSHTEFYSLIAPE